MSAYYSLIDPIAGKLALDAIQADNASVLEAEFPGHGNAVEVPAGAKKGWVLAGGTYVDSTVLAATQFVALQAALAADIDQQAEAQRLKYVTGGASQAMVYLQKQTQAVQALAGLAATPPMTAAQGAASFGLLAATIGSDVDPQTNAPAVDVFGVARLVVATVQQWLPIAAAIEKIKAAAKSAIATAATAQAAQAAHDGVAWPAAS